LDTRERKFRKALSRNDCKTLSSHAGWKKAEAITGASVIETVLGGRRWVVPLAWSTLPPFVALMTLAEYLERVTQPTAISLRDGETNLE
jgi:hypothetical protein